MKTASMVRGSLTRLIVLTQAVLLIPPLLLGSLCLKDGGAALELVSCSCSFESWTPSPAPSTQIEADCGPCRDVTLSALSSRVDLSAPLQGLSLNTTLPQPVASASLPDPTAPEPSGSPPERSFSVLRC
jgi:hypothetical protein